MPSSRTRRSSCVEFLQWALPQLGYAWPGFRRVHRQVCKRVGRRLRDLHLGDMDAYRRYLEAAPDEWRILDSLCGIPISRFGRDWRVFEYLGQHVLPELARAVSGRHAERVEAWCAGCAGGEEPYTLSAAWHFMVAPSWPQISLAIVATDFDAYQLGRARLGRYRASSLQELPSDWRDIMFERDGAEYRIRSRFKECVRFVVQDVRDVAAGESIDLILCRNLVLTYFSEPVRDQVLQRLATALRPGGVLVIGMRERIPLTCSAFEPWRPEIGIYRRSASSAA